MTTVMPNRNRAVPMKSGKGLGELAEGFPIDLDRGDR
jgi:hypothetical protein